MYFISVSAGILHMQGHQCTAKWKNAPIYSQKGRQETAQKINLHLPSFMQTAEPSLMVKPLMKTDKNIKYSDIPFTHYQKRPDVRSWSCYHQANDRH